MTADGPARRTVEVEGFVRSRLAELTILSSEALEIGVDEDLWAVGLTSLGSIQLLVAIEDHFGLLIPDERLSPTTFTSIATIVETTVQELAGEAQGGRPPDGS